MIARGLSVMLEVSVGGTQLASAVDPPEDVGGLHILQDSDM